MSDFTKQNVSIDILALHLVFEIYLFNFIAFTVTKLRGDPFNERYIFWDVPRLWFFFESLMVHGMEVKNHGDWLATRVPKI